MTKNKKQKINRELLLGGTVIAAVTPLAILIIATIVLAFVLGVVLVINTEQLQSIGLIMIGVYGVFLLIFGWTFWRIINRTTLLIRHKRELHSEQERITDMLDGLADEIEGSQTDSVNTEGISGHNLEQDYTVVSDEDETDSLLEPDQWVDGKTDVSK